MKNLVNNQIHLDFLTKDTAFTIIKSLLDYIITKELSENFLNNVGPLILTLLEFKQISDDGTIVYQISKLLCDFCQNPSNIDDEFSKVKGIYTIFEAIVSCKSQIEVNAPLIINLLLETTKPIFNNLLSKIEKNRNLSSPDNLIRLYILLILESRF